jgi:tetratricopeptide (TPR) repeat protein
MSNSISYNERLLKIFAGVRCLNKDQLPRYMEGRLTDIEKHLVEQHLVDCDLCYDALEALQKEGQLEQYTSLSAGIQQYIRSSIKPVSQLQKMERYLRKAKKRESMLIYFWLVAFVAGGGSLIYLMQQYNRNKPVLARPAAVPVVPAAAIAATPPGPDGDSNIVAGQQVTLASAGSTTPLPAAPVPRTDTAKAAPVVRKPVDSAAHKAAAARAADSLRQKKADSLRLKKTAVKDSTPKQQKDTPIMAAAAAAKTEKNNISNNKEKEENNNTSKAAATAPSPSSPNAVDTDEYLYRAAMVYQQQGNLNEAISRYKRLTSNTGRVGEMARYQMAVCYRDKGQTGKAKRMFKEVVRMDGSMKQAAQQALDNL